MKFNLKNRPQWYDSRDSIDKWFEGFEKELRLKLENQRLCISRFGGTATVEIKEILGE